MTITVGKTGIVRLDGDDLTNLRRECFRRDNWKCVECGRDVSDRVPEWSACRAHMAHIIGRGAGGSDELSNIRCLCNRCHIVDEHNPKSVPMKR